jgi:hypothetical protein
MGIKSHSNLDAMVVFNGTPLETRTPPLWRLLNLYLLLDIFYNLLIMTQQMHSSPLQRNTQNGYAYPAVTSGLIKTDSPNKTLRRGGLRLRGTDTNSRLQAQQVAQAVGEEQISHEGNVSGMSIGLHSSH